MVLVPPKFRNNKVIIGVANPPPVNSGTYLNENDMKEFIEDVYSAKTLEESIPVHLNHITHDAEGKPAIPAGHVIGAEMHPVTKKLIVALLVHDTPTGKYAEKLMQNGQLSLEHLSLGVDSIEEARFWSKKLGPIGYTPVSKKVREVSVCLVGDRPNTEITRVMTLGEFMDGVPAQNTSPKGIHETNHINKDTAIYSDTSHENQVNTPIVVSTVACALSPYATLDTMTGMYGFGKVNINPELAQGKFTPVIENPNYSALRDIDTTPARSHIMNVWSQLENQQPRYGVRSVSTTASAGAPESNVSTSSSSDMNVDAPNSTEDKLAEAINQLKQVLDQNAVREIEATVEKQKQAEANQPPVAQQQQQQQPEINPSEMDLTLPNYAFPQRPRNMEFDEFVRSKLNLDPATLTDKAREALQATLESSNKAQQIPFEMEAKRLADEKLEFQDLLRKTLPSILESMRKQDPNADTESFKRLYGSIPLIEDAKARNLFKEIVRLTASATSENKALHQKTLQMTASQREKQFNHVDELIKSNKEIQNAADKAISQLKEAQQEFKRLKTEHDRLVSKYPHGYLKDDRIVTSTTASAGASGNFVFNATRNATTIPDTAPSKPINVLGAVAYMEAAKLFPEASSEFPGYLERTRDVWSDLQKYRLDRPPAASDFRGQAERIRQDMKYNPPSGGYFGTSPYATLAR